MRYKEDISTANPNILVHETWSYQGDGSVVVRGYPIEKETGTRVDGIKTIKRRVSSKELLAITKNQIANQIISRISEQERSRYTRVRKRDEADQLVLERIKEIKENPDVMIRPGKWNKAREQTVLSDVENHILPFLRESGPDLLPGDVQELRAQLIDRAVNDPRHKHHRSTTEQGIDSRLRAMDVAYRFLFEAYPEQGLPDVSFAPLGRRPNIHLEQVKSLPREVRRKLIRTITKLTRSDPRLAYVSVLMLDAALRTGEACGTIPADIHFEEAYTTVFVGWQVQSGSITSTLKSEAAYRYVSMSYWGTVMIQRCLRQFEADGIIVDRDHPVMMPDKASSNVRKLLLNCGLTQEAIEASRELQRLEPDIGVEGETVTVEAYILRRDRASRWVSRCGLEADAVDYMLGHKRQIPSDLQKDYRLPEEQALIAQCLERDIYDPAISRNPAYRPISLKPDQDLHLIPNMINRFEVLSDAPVQIEISFRANALGDIVRLTAPEGSIKTIQSKDSTDTKPAKTTLPQHPEGGVYNDNS